MKIFSFDKSSISQKIQTNLVSKKAGYDIMRKSIQKDIQVNDINRMV